MLTKSMYKRPAIRKRAPTEKEQNSYHEEILRQQAEKRKAYYDKLRKIKPSTFPWVKKFRHQKPLFKILDIQTNLFNADGICQISRDPMDIFDWIIEDRSEFTEVVSMSLKGGRFKELARYNSKGVIRLSKGTPNQIGIKFVIDGKNNYVNIFENGSVRWGGASDDYKVLDFIRDIVGKINYIEYSNRSGQMRVNKELDLKKLSELIDPKLFSSGTSVKYDRGRLTLSIGEINLKKTEKEVSRHKVEKVQLREKEYEYTEQRTKSANLTFYKSGIVQYQGKYVTQTIIVDIAHSLLNKFQRDGIFLGEGQPVKPKVQKEEVYKTRSRNPPYPPNSFEGKCKTGYYCRPNAQGFPTCYVIPAINASSRKTVVESYKTAGVKIPNSVKELFKIEKESEPVYDISVALEKQTYKGKTVQVLKIGGRQAMRMTEDQLENVARKKQIPGIQKGQGVTKMVARMIQHLLKSDSAYIDQKDKLRIGERLCTSMSKKELVALGYPGTSEDMTLEKICTRIEYLTRGIKEKHNFEVEGTKYTIEGDKILGSQRRNGKPNPGRKCATIPTETLYKYARAMGIETSGKSKPQICKEMQEKKLASRKVIV